MLCLVMHVMLMYIVLLCIYLCRHVSVISEKENSTTISFPVLHTTLHGTFVQENTTNFTLQSIQNSTDSFSIAVKNHENSNSSQFSLMTKIPSHIEAETSQISENHSKKRISSKRSSDNIKNTLLPLSIIQVIFFTVPANRAIPSPSPKPTSFVYPNSMATVISKAAIQTVKDHNVQVFSRVTPSSDRVGILKQDRTRLQQVHLTEKADSERNLNYNMNMDKKKRDRNLLVGKTIHHSFFNITDLYTPLNSNTVNMPKTQYDHTTFSTSDTITTPSTFSDLTSSAIIYSDSKQPHDLTKSDTGIEGISCYVCNHSQITTDCENTPTLCGPNQVNRIFST